MISFYDYCDFIIGLEITRVMITTDVIAVIPPTVSKLY